MSQFEQHIKQSLQNFEAEYNPADWSDMQNRLNKTKAGKPNNIGKGLLVAASVVAVGGLIYYFSTANTENNIAPVVSTQQVVVESTTAPEESNNSHIDVVTQKDQPVAGSDAQKIAQNNTTESKVTVSKSTVQPVINNAGENVNSIPESPKKEDVAVAVPVQSTSPVFTASFRASASKVCEGATVQFVSDNNEPSCTYKWYFGDGSSSSEQSPSHIFAEAGTYNVKLHVASAKAKKQADQKSAITVVAAPSLRISYSVSEDNNLLVNFEADADKAGEWKWNFGDSQTSSVQNPSHIYSKKGNYKAELTAKNSAGCTAVEVKDVILKNELNLLAPNAFSPDGNGVNDTWMPVALLNGDYIFTLTILDKAGNVVYKTVDKNQPWEGQNTRTGDTYLWRVVVKDKNGDVSNQAGTIVIVE